MFSSLGIQNNNNNNMSVKKLAKPQKHQAEAGNYLNSEEEIQQKLVLLNRSRYFTDDLCGNAESFERLWGSPKVSEATS